MPDRRMILLLTARSSCVVVATIGQTYFLDCPISALLGFYSSFFTVVEPIHFLSPKFSQMGGPSTAIFPSSRCHLGFHNGGRICGLRGGAAFLPSGSTDEIRVRPAVDLLPCPRI
jgi:hypothetical protein